MEYEPIIKVNKLVSPLGESKYFAKVDIYEIGNASKGPIVNNLGEVHGKTEAEAREKMQEKVSKWLKNMVV